MSGRSTHEALRFSKHTAAFVARHGLKAGLAKSAARANPVGLVLSAAESVLGVVDSWLKLATLRAQLDGLRATVPLQASTMEITRQKLRDELSISREELRQNQATRQRIIRINQLCAGLCQEILRGMREIRQQEIPDIENFEQMNRQLTVAWTRMREALDHFNQTTH